MPKIIFSVINDYTGDQRIQRIAEHLTKSGYSVSIVCRELPDSLPLQGFPYPIYRMRLGVHKGKWFYLWFQVRLFLKLLLMKADILTANDLDTLLPNYIVSKIKGIPLVYDSHEYYTESPEIIHRPTVQNLWLMIEKWIFPRLKSAMTVNNSIAKIYSEKYNVPVGVVRNLPFRRETPALDYTAKKTAGILIYQGALNIGRGIEIMIEAMAFLPEYKLWIIGKGDIQALLIDRAKRLSNVEFIGFLPPNRLREYTEKALLGLSLEEAMGLNYYYASPNKIVDYIQAGVPYLCSDLPEMVALTHKYQTGSIVQESDRTPKSLAILIQSIIDSPERYLQYYEQCKKAAAILCWENECHHLNLIYDGL